MVTLKAKTALSAVALGFMLQAPSSSWGQTVTQVSGTDPQTRALNQSETAASVSVFPDREVEIIATNDTNELFVYDTFSRRVFAGGSLMGWYFRERTATNPNPAWQHGQLVPGVGAAANVAVLWSDPGVASAPDAPHVALLATLMVPTAKFPTVAQSPCTDPSGNTVGCIQGSVAGFCSPLGGACVARSLDGGKTFNMLHCFGDTTPGVCGPSQLGHFYDGMDIAFQNGAAPSGYVAMVDVDTDREALWVLPNAETSTTLTHVQDGVGSMGPLLLGGVEDTGTHLRVRVDGQNRLWRMTIGSQTRVLKVNFLGRNAPPKGLSSFITPDDATPVNGVPNGLNDPNGQMQDSIRFGPQFDFDIGKNEAGQDEMRYVYLAKGPDSAGTGATLGLVQGGFCTIDLGTCFEPPEWHSEVFQIIDGQRGHRQFHPAIKYGFDGRFNLHFWKVSYYQLNEGLDQVAIFAGDFKKNAAGAPQQFTAQAVTPLQRPCPDERTEEDYWGDYDDMSFNDNRCTFIRPFTDSTQGCVSRRAFDSQHQHVSAVEIPCQDPQSLRKVTFDYHLFLNDDDFGDPDDCRTYGFTRDGCSSRPALHAECTVHPNKLIDPEREIFNDCIPDELTGRVLLRCELLPDFRTVRVIVQPVVHEGTSCNNDEDGRGLLIFDVPAGAVLGNGFVIAEVLFNPTNGSPYDRTEVIFPPNSIVNTTMF